LLYNIARPFRGRRALEVGCWLGWSAAHLAAAGVVLDVVDPALANPMIQQSVNDSLASAGLASAVTLYAAASPSAIDQIAKSGVRWSLFFVDGNHEAPYPLFGTATAVEFAEPDAAMVFHDLASPDGAQALEYLVVRGWHVRVFHTAQIMGMAWRGDVAPPERQADPGFAWHVPKHVRKFMTSEEIDLLRS
jgi:predicted O-methyltransferase YrrM